MCTNTPVRLASHVICVCIIFFDWFVSRETILSEVASHLFPSTAPTVEYLAPAVPVPIPSGKNRLAHAHIIICHCNNDNIIGYS